MRIVAAVTLALTACSFHPRADNGGDAAQASEAGLDGAPPADTVDADDRTCSSVDGLLGPLCLRPSGGIAFDGPVFDTTADALCDASILAVCVVAAQTITTTNPVTVTGSRPLVLFAAEAIHVTGTLDASSKHGAASGAGARSSPCNSPRTVPDASDLGAGGGAGGSFGEVGGDGGGGNVNQSGGAPVMLGGTAGLPIPALAVRGGCPGQPGATGVGPDDGGAAGDGGGALYLFAAGSIVIDGAVLASGAGGTGGFDDSGGGGGGAGGLVGLESPTIAVTGIVAANGGGGGGGGSIDDPFFGGPGDDGAASPFNGVAQGGTPGFDSVTGGHGSSVAATQGAQPAPADGGGGGGGGGLGVVWVHGALTGTQVSPAAQVH